MMTPENSQRGTLIGVAVIIAGGVVAGLLLGRGDTEPTALRVAAVDTPKPPPMRAATPAAASKPAAPAVPLLSEAELVALADDSMSGPASSRLAAIDRLSRAPRDQALPLLKRVLLNGEPGVDRPAALQALRELALSQGDGDQRIRDAVREAIYHGDDENLATDAQEVLDVIAESEST
jgi:hypothetical protein